MPSPREKLADALKALQVLQEAGSRVIQSRELSRLHRERLLNNGFLQEVVKGWLISSSPGVRAGDSTPWYASFWEFCARYCEDRFGGDWHVSPEQSLLLLAENTVIPKQLVVYAPKGSNNNLELLFGTSLYDLKSETPDAALLTERNGLRLFSPAATLVKIPESLFRRHPIETQVVLAGLRDASDLLRLLLSGGNSTKAGMLAGALRRVGRPEFADEILKAMSVAGYDVRERDPFDAVQSFGVLAAVSLMVGRMRVMWKSMRDDVIVNFPAAPGLPRDKDAYLRFVDDIYKSDAYHSLSIEGYNVTPALVERVQAGNWDPSHHEDDRKNRDALVARGYWQAFQRVKAAVAEVISGANPGERARATHMDWYRELFQPCVAAGIMPTGALAGYRNDAVYVRTSRYVPPRWEAVRDAMPELFSLLEQEEHPSVRAVLGHWLFGYIHPFPDGNGCMARFLMNVMRASGGYPWTVIRKEDRDTYLSALDAASIDMKIAPFTAYVAKCVHWSMDHAPSDLANRP